MDEDLICQICYEYFDCPCSLNCGHTFCKYCISNCLKSKPVCPICRTPNLQDTKNLKENLAIKNIQISQKKLPEKNNETNKQKSVEQVIGEENFQRLPKNKQEDKDKEYFFNFMLMYILNPPIILSPFTQVTIRGYIKYCPLDQFKEICQDRVVVIPLETEKFEKDQQIQHKYGVKVEVLKIEEANFQKNGWPVLNMEIKVLQRVIIEKIETIHNEEKTDVQNQHKSQIDNNRQNNLNREQNIKEEEKQEKIEESKVQSESIPAKKYDFEICKGFIYEDLGLESITPNSIQNLKSVCENINQLIQQTIQNSPKDDFTFYNFQRSLQQSRIFEYLQKIQQNDNNVQQQISQFSFVISDYFRFNQKQKLRYLQLNIEIIYIQDCLKLKI